MSETAEMHEQITSKRPLITLAIFSYNQEDFIAEAIEGALAQTYAPLEIIVSDDCSTDATFEVIQKTLQGRQTPHAIRINRNEVNLGVCAHVNRVFQLARGRLIVMNGGDDISLPARVQAVHDAWVDHGHPGAVHSRWNEIDENGVTIASSRPPSKTPDGGVMSWRHPQFFEQVEDANLFQYTGAALAFDLDAITGRFPPLDPRLKNEDHVLYFRACLAGGVVYLATPLVKYRQHSNNLHSLEKRRLSGRDLCLAEKEAVVREHRLRRLLHYRMHVQDIDAYFSEHEITGELMRLRNAIADRVLALQRLVRWWDMNTVQRLRAFRIVAEKGALRERRWAAKRRMPWRVFEFLVTKPWRRLPHLR